MTLVELGDLTWPEAQTLGAQGAVGLVPVGSIEQHGPHLPLTFDSTAAGVLVREAAARIVEPVVVPPLLTAGLSDHHLAFPGTISLSSETFGAVLTAYVEALERVGVDRVAIVSAHGGNFTFIGEFGREYTAKRPSTTVVGYDDLETFAGAMFAAGAAAGVEAPVTDVHAGRLETSMALHLIGADRVRTFDDVDGYVAAQPGWHQRLRAEGVRTLSETGVLGSPPGATAEAGRAITAALVDLIVAWLARELGVTRR